MIELHFKLYLIRKLNILFLVVNGISMIEVIL